MRVTDSDLISVETVSRLLKGETLIDLPGLKLRGPFVVLIEKELVSPVNPFNYILNCLGIKVSPMRKSRKAGDSALSSISRRRYSVPFHTGRGVTSEKVEIPTA